VKGGQRGEREERVDRQTQADMKMHRCPLVDNKSASRHRRAEREYWKEGGSIIIREEHTRTPHIFMGS
jgi:hypothetical protein